MKICNPPALSPGFAGSLKKKPWPHYAFLAGSIVTTGFAASSGWHYFQSGTQETKVNGLIAQKAELPLVSPRQQDILTRSGTEPLPFDDQQWLVSYLEDTAGRQRHNLALEPRILAAELALGREQDATRESLSDSAHMAEITAMAGFLGYKMRAGDWTIPEDWLKSET